MISENLTLLLIREIFVPKFYSKRKNPNIKTYTSSQIPETACHFFTPISTQDNRTASNLRHSKEECSVQCNYEKCVDEGKYVIFYQTENMTGSVLYMCKFSFFFTRCVLNILYKYNKYKNRIFDNIFFQNLPCWWNPDVD